MMRQLTDCKIPSPITISFVAWRDQFINAVSGLEGAFVNTCHGRAFQGLIAYTSPA